MDLATFLAVFRAFEHKRIEYVLAGPFAAAVSGYAQGAEQIDVIVQPDAANLIRLHRTLLEWLPATDFDAVAGLNLAFRWTLQGTPISFVFYSQPLDAIAYESFHLGGVSIRVAPPEFHHRILPVRRVEDVGRCLRAVFNLTAQLVGPRKRQRGVRKYRNWPAAVADRARLADEHAQRIRTERLRK